MDSSTIATPSFFNFILLNYGIYVKKLLMDWTSTRHQLATSMSRRQFLLSCRSHDIFPQHIYNTVIVEPMLTGEMAVNYLWKAVNSVVAEGLSECCKLKPEDPILWLANWLLINNPYKP
ncbi:nucleoside diphosphate kinase homolog 5-like [Leptopilina heterotoma]|uniref:nucleoside diphosphate kinase homolog 5-like n=1 Tax=Leptopilina heterotoma TaxID=63436 RepID=UPI001CA81315|nr:nucleoside diphosphate kinase homolog 5-like [Leptopilina heterotoma]